MDYPEQGATVASLDWKGRLAWGLGWASTAVFSACERPSQRFSLADGSVLPDFARVLSLFMRKVNKRRKRAKGARIVADPYGVNACLAVLFISLCTCSLFRSCASTHVLLGIGNALGLAGILTISIEPSYILYQLPWILANAVPLLLDGLVRAIPPRFVRFILTCGFADDRTASASDARGQQERSCERRRSLVHPHACQTS